MASKSKKNQNSNVKPPRELIMVAKADLGLRVNADSEMTSLAGADVDPLTQILSDADVTVVPLFDTSEDRLQDDVASLSGATGLETPDLSVYYQVHAPDDKLDELAKKLNKLDTVEAAYVKPAAELARLELQEAVPDTEEAPPVTPDFMPRQGYLFAAPGGIEAQFAWGKPGGRGTTVRVIDIEGGWRFTHEDLLANQGGVVGGTPTTASNWLEHGTAVIGEIGGDINNFGIRGIAPDANTRAISIFGTNQSTSKAIKDAANLLNAGDIILIELHRPGPKANNSGQFGFIAIEWWPDDFDAIKYATNKGVIVVEAAGNGSQNLDDPVYNVKPSNFPNSWKNPFNRNNRDSGAIVVGAGAPPPGTHGKNHGPDRSRLDFSNYGRMLDAQGWGREVTTTGYGDLQGGTNPNLWYTDTFSGTSSASPIVVGALACVQGMLRAANKPKLNPLQARNLLRTTGSPQQPAPGKPVTQRIGNRPNLRQMHQKLFPKIFKEGKEFKELKEHKLEAKENLKRELKELKEKEIKPEIEKNPLENKIREKFIENGGTSGTGDDDFYQMLGLIAGRLDSLEMRLSNGHSFIEPEERPELGKHIFEEGQE
jgi:Subtilase family